MPQINEIRLGREIGKDTCRYVYHACIDCGRVESLTGYDL